MATATRRFTTTTTGPDNPRPVALLATSKIDTLIGSIIQLDGRKSYDPEGQPLTFKWSFTQVPIGSEVESAGFKAIRPNSAAVSFIPDKTGLYLIELVVNDGELDSRPAVATVNIQLSRVPCGENIIPDAEFLWNYISDFWKLVEDRNKISSIWSAVIQQIGAELIKLWGNDYNKSLSTIQSTFQRRWQKFSMDTDLLSLTDQKVIVGKTDSGVGGFSGTLGVAPGTGFTTLFHVPLGPVGDGDHTDFRNLLGNYGPKGRVLVVQGSPYVIDQVLNQSVQISTGTDLVTSLASHIVTSASAPFLHAEVGDYLVIKSGPDAGSYKIKSIADPTTATVVFLYDPPGGPYPIFSAGTGISFDVTRLVSSVVVQSQEIPDGLIEASWRVPHLLQTPSLDLEAEGCRAGDILVFEVTRSDIGVTTEISAQVVGVKGGHLGFEFSMSELDPSMNEGSDASIVESSGIVTVSGLHGMRPTSVGGYLEVLNGDNPGRYKIRQYLSSESVIIDNTLAVGSDSGNPGIQWVERSKTGGNFERAIFQKIVRDLRIVPASSGDQEAERAAEALIAFMPLGINLSTRPFSKFGITFKAKRIRHNTAIKVSTDLVSAPVLQESVIDPPVALRENLDYLVEAGFITFVNGLFGLGSPAPETMWAEVAVYDNSPVVERNFGRLVDLSRDDLTQKRTRAPYLSAVKGLIFAFTNGPVIANVRLGLQILLGLPFSEEQGVILEIQESFTVDVNGTPLGRILIEDVDEFGKRSGFRRVYLYPVSVGLELNPSTSAPYAVGDRVERFAPLSKGVEATDYVKDPVWWVRSLYGLEILKYFTFKVIIDSKIFDSNDVQFGLEFARAIKPAYTNLISTALVELSDDIVVTGSMGGSATLKFYDSPWGLQAANRVGDLNSQGAVLWNAGSYPFSTRTTRLLKDVITSKVGAEVRATSVTGWDPTMIRGRKHDATMGFPSLDEGRMPPQEGDILLILSGQPGASELIPGAYEIETVIDGNTLKLGWVAGSVDPDQYVVAEVEKPALDPDLFQYGSGLYCCILRRENPTVLWGTDLVTDGTNVVTSASAGFLKNHVRVGDRLCMEVVGANFGEYLVDTLENSGLLASISTPTLGISTVTGLTGMTLASERGTLEFLSGLNKGVYRITEFVSATSVKIRHSGALLESSVPWRETPRAPYLSETQVALKNPDGTAALLSADSGQRFRIIRPFLHKSRLERIRFLVTSDNLLQAGYVTALGIGLASEWRDCFTPGMEGMLIRVSESDDPVNDGEFLITHYYNSGRVGIDNASGISDPSPGPAVVTLSRSP